MSKRGIPIPSEFFGKAFWRDKSKVIRMADKMGKGQTVYKHPDRDNYNITFTSREDDLPTGSIIIHRTGE